jgi:integrase
MFSFAGTPHHQAGAGKRRAKLQVQSLRGLYERLWTERLRNLAAQDQNLQTRLRVVQVFQSCAGGLPHEEALGPFLELMTAQGLAASTRRTYLTYVITALRLRGALVRVVLKVSEQEHARAQPVYGLKVPTLRALDRVFETYAVQRAPGNVRGCLALLALTGGRVRDIAALRGDEIVISNHDGVQELWLLWSQMKQRRKYRHRVTIRYPAEVTPTESGWFGEALNHLRGYRQQGDAMPMSGVTAARVNQLLRLVHEEVPDLERFTSRSFRAAFALRAERYVRSAGTGERLSDLTGHLSDQMPRAVYMRNAVSALGM